MTNLWERDSVLWQGSGENGDTWTSTSLNDFIPNNGIVVEESIFASLYQGLEEKMQHAIWAVRYQVTSDGRTLVISAICRRKMTDCHCCTVVVHRLRQPS